MPPRTVLLKKKVFDYRLLRARRIIENSFGIATARFRIFRRPINAKISTVKSVTKAVVGLHNFLMKKTTKVIVSIVLQIISTERKMIMLFLGTGNRNKTLFPFLKRCWRIGSKNYSKTAKAIRNKFKDYFVNEGAVDWQWDIVNKANWILVLPLLFTE